MRLRERIKNLKNLPQGIKNINQQQQMDINIYSSLGTGIGLGLAFFALGANVIINFNWLQFFFCIVILFGSIQQTTTYFSLSKAKRDLEIYNKNLESQTNNNIGNDQEEDSELQDNLNAALQ